MFSCSHSQNFISVTILDQFGYSQSWQIFIRLSFSKVAWGRGTLEIKNGASALLGFRVQQERWTFNKEPQFLVDPTGSEKQEELNVLMT